MKKFLTLVLIAIFFAVKAQYIGINNQNPTAALDVNGDIRVRSLETSSSFSIYDNFVLADSNNKLKTVKFSDLNLPQVSKVGTVMSVINSKLDIAPEVVVQSTANQTTDGTGTPKVLNTLNKELVDNYNAYSNGVFNCPISGVYMIILSFQTTSSNTSNHSANNVIGIWNDSTNKWVARINDTDMSINTTNKLRTSKLLTAINMTAGTNYSIRFIAGVSGSTTNTFTVLGNTNLITTQNSPSIIRIIRVK
ncbi:hypothetical protein GCM10010992_25030 [Cloacibacterium rupense]|uniref:C1q domain-containing protein n=1 Tax=Cloacibacterium rupense TaxID=517423 RepID=A0ABQ2NNZ1_9FLAO|nr:hypothetical protein [Cloacibacterium rupense]GGP06112.1 hypothetical protein GCM10010992_25030 [Cloacibacterium rupense]